MNHQEYTITLIIDQIENKEQVAMQQRAGSNCTRRCLFGPCDTVELREETEKALRDIRKEKSQKWNFDFKNFTPLPGQYDWQLVESPSTSYTQQTYSQHDNVASCNQLTPSKKSCNANTSCIDQEKNNPFPHNNNLPLQSNDSVVVNTSDDDDLRTNSQVKANNTNSISLHQTNLSEESQIKRERYLSNESTCCRLPNNKGTYHLRSDRTKPSYKSTMLVTSVITGKNIKLIIINRW